MANSFVPFTTQEKKPLVQAEATITDHRAPGLSDGGVRTYSQIKSAFRTSATQKKENSRFSLSELVSSHLSLEEEERHRFEKKVSESVESEIGKIKDAVREVAQKEGFEAGRKAAYDEEKLRLAKVIEGLAELMGSMEKAKLELAAHYEGQLLEIAYRMAKTVVHREIVERPASIVSTINEILSRISKDDDVTIRLAAHEYSSLEMIKQELEKVSRNGRIHFEFNDNLSKGDCVVESLSGEIASYINQKLKKLSQSIFKKEIKDEPTDAQVEAATTTDAEAVEAASNEAASSQAASSAASSNEAAPQVSTGKTKPEGDGNSEGGPQGAQGTGT